VCKGNDAAAAAWGARATTKTRYDRQAVILKEGTLSSKGWFKVDKSNTTTSTEFQIPSGDNHMSSATHNSSTSNTTMALGFLEEQKHPCEFFSPSYFSTLLQQQSALAQKRKEKIMKKGSMTATTNSQQQLSLGMALMAGNFVFLGDYVDRGKNCLEVIAYLHAMKLLLPHKITLLRGSHETRDVNGWEEHYGQRSFLSQCNQRFGEQLGKAPIKSLIECHLPLLLIRYILCPWRDTTTSPHME